MPPAQSGIADYAASWCAAMQGAGVEVAVVDTASALGMRSDAPEWRGVQLVHAEIGGGRGGEFLALEQLNAMRPDLPLTATVHDPERLIWRAPMLPPALGWAARLPRPLPQLAMLACDPVTLARERRLASSLAGMVTLTATGAACLSARMQVPAARVHVIEHGNAVMPSAPLPPPEPLRLLYFGFVYPGKGLEDLLAAVAKVVVGGARDLRLTIAGGSAPELAFGGRADYVAGLRALAGTMGIGQRLDWRLNLPAAEVPGLIQSHHVLVLPYRESRKLSLLGRMRGTSGALSWANACGRGVIASDARAFPEEVSHGNGMVFPEGDVAALAACIERLLHEPALAQAWAACASTLGVERGWGRVAERFRSFFSETINGRVRA